MQQKTEKQATGGLIQLDGEERHAVGGHGRDPKGHPRPAGGGGNAVAAPGQEAAHPAKGVEQGDGGDQVGPQLGEGDLAPPAEQPNRGQSAEQPAIKDEPTREVAGGKGGRIGCQQGEVLEQLGQLEQQVEKFCAYQCPQNPKEKGLLCPAGVFSPGFELPVEVQPRGSSAQQGQQAVRGEESAAKIPIG